MQCPGVVLIVINANARIACDDVILHRQNCRFIHVNPSHLPSVYSFIVIDLI